MLDNNIKSEERLEYLTSNGQLDPVIMEFLTQHDWLTDEFLQRPTPECRAQIAKEWVNFLNSLVTFLAPELVVQVAENATAHTQVAARELAYFYSRIGRNVLNRLKSLNRECYQIVLLLNPIAHFTLNEAIPFNAKNAHWDEYLREIIALVRKCNEKRSSELLSRAEVLALVTSPARDAIDYAWLVEAVTEDSSNGVGSMSRRSYAKSLERQVVSQYRLRTEQRIPQVIGGYVYPVPFTADQICVLIDNLAAEASTAFFTALASALANETLVRVDDGGVNEIPIEFPDQQDEQLIMGMYEVDAETHGALLRQSLLRQLEYATVDETRAFVAAASLSKSQEKLPWKQKSYEPLIATAVCQRVDAHAIAMQVSEKISHIDRVLKTRGEQSVWDYQLAKRFEDAFTQLSFDCAPFFESEEDAIEFAAKQHALISLIVDEVFASLIPSNAELFEVAESGWCTTESTTALLEALSVKFAEVFRRRTAKLKQEQSVTLLPLVLGYLAELSVSLMAARVVAQSQQLTLRADLAAALLERQIAQMLAGPDLLLHSLLALRRPSLFYSLEEFGDPIRRTTQANENYFSHARTLYQKLESQLLERENYSAELFEGVCLSAKSPYSDYHYSGCYSLLSAFDDWFLCSIEQSVLFPAKIRGLLMENHIAELSAEFTGDAEKLGWFAEHFIESLHTHTHTPTIWHAILLQSMDVRVNNFARDISAARKKRKNMVRSVSFAEEKLIQEYGQLLKLNEQLQESAFS